MAELVFEYEMKIIGLWNGSISGEFTTIVDLYYNLRNYINVEFHLCVTKKELITSCIKHLIKNNNSDLLNHITLQKSFESDLIICTSFLVYSEIEMKSKNLFILDSFDLVKNDYVLPDLINDHIVLFCNPANFTKKIPYDQIEYYHKFSYTRLDNFPKYYKVDIHTKEIELFLLDCLYYNRTTKPFIQIKENEYWENIGKRIFEHLYHNKRVNYNCNGFSKPDGLFYYLKLFDINAFESTSDLKVSKIEIQEKLFMSENDNLLKSIKEILCL